MRSHCFHWEEGIGKKCLRHSAFSCELLDSSWASCYLSPEGPLLVGLKFNFNLGWLWLGVTSSFPSLAGSQYLHQGVLLCQDCVSWSLACGGGYIVMVCVWVGCGSV